MKAISFLGFNCYQPTTYTRLDTGERCTTRLFQEALIELYRPDVMVVLLTPKAEREIPLDVRTKSPCDSGASNWELLNSALDSRVRLVPVFGIPEEAQDPEAYAWHVFGRIAEHVDHEEEVLLDITHGYRAMSAIALGAMAYLQHAKGARVQRVVYGAYEAPSLADGSKPVWDLTGIATIAGWTSAADDLVCAGDASRLAEQVRPIDSQLADCLERVSRALQLLRLAEIGPAAADLLAQLRLGGFQQPALQAIARSIERVFQPLAYSSSDTAVEQLRKQYDLLRWFFDRRRSLEAATLATEWLLSVGVWLAEQSGRPNVARDLVRQALNLNEPPHPNDNPEFIAVRKTILSRTGAANLTSAWRKIRPVRNDLSHCGFLRHHNTLTVSDYNVRENELRSLLGNVRQLLN